MQILSLVPYNQCHNKLILKWYKYISNKMVHLKYPILEIWCCHKHTTQLPHSRLKFDTKLRKVFPNNLAPQLCTSHSRRENIAPNFVCFFEPIKCKHVKLRFLATFGTCYSSQMPSSRLKCGKKLRNTSQVGLSAQHCTSHCYR